jgi:hypothetical protein
MTVLCLKVVVPPSGRGSAGLPVPRVKTTLPDLDKTWDAQNYVSKELKSGRSPNQPCNSVGLGDGVILRKTEQFPSRFSFV